MQRLEVSGAVRHIYASLGFKGLIHKEMFFFIHFERDFQGKRDTFKAAIPRYQRL